MVARSWLVPVVLIAGILAAGAAGGQPAAGEAASPARVGPPLQEGSYLLEIKGTLRREPGGGWHFRVAADDPDRVSAQLQLLPCPLLATMERLAESQPQQEILFDLTAQVFSYRGRTYLLPTHAPRLVGAAPGLDEEMDSGGGAETAEEILRELEQAVGPIVRSPAAGLDEAEPLDAFVLWRRGWMVRAAGGAWSFVYEADATGLADPPVILLPCRLLERMARRAARGPMLVSGRVFPYHGRNYLLPTSFQIPRGRTALQP